MKGLNIVTNYKDDAAIQKRVAEHLAAFKEKHPDVDWFVIAAQGSQNYKLDYEDSDVDTKILTLPSFDELVLNKKPLNYTLVLDDGTEEHCDIKDVRMFFKTFRKQNINFVEILYTPYWIVNPKYKDIWFEMLAMREELVHMNRYAAVSCMVGCAREKYHALCHKYPSKVDVIEKFGYDCYSDDTLFLTNNGWKLFDEVNNSDLLATINPETKGLEFQSFLNRTSKEVDKTYTIENWYSKFEVSENHNLFCSDVLNRNKYGLGYNEERSNWHLEPLSDNFKNRGPGHTKDKHILSFPYNFQECNPDYSDNFLMLLGAFISEGSIAFRDKEQTQIRGIRIYQTNHGKEEFFDMMEDIRLEYPGFTGSYKREHRDDTIETVWDFGVDVSKKCYELVGHISTQKAIDKKFLFSLSKEQCKKLLYGMLLGDGSKDKDSPRWIYYTSSYELAKDTLLLAHLAGYEANLLGGPDGYYYPERISTYGNIPMYQVSIRDKELAPSTIKISLQQGRGSSLIVNNETKKVVCFEVPNHTLVTMKDGKTAVQGNCKQLHHLIRLSHFFRHYINNEPYEDCLILPPGTRTHLIELKRNGCGYTKEEAIEVAEKTLDWLSLAADQVRGKVPMTLNVEKYEVYENIEDAEMSKFLDDTLYKLISRSLKEALKED